MKRDRNTTDSLFVMLLCAGLFQIQGPVLAQLTLSTPDTVIVANCPNAMVTIPLNLTNPSGAPLKAVGLTFCYPTMLLTYDTVSTAGTLTQGWIAANGREINPGEITIGAFNTSAATGSGILMNVIFKVKANVSGCDSLRLKNFRDDLTSAMTINGYCIVDSCRTTAVDSHTTQGFPSKYELSQNYPNPFNPSTIIGYSIPIPQSVKLKVYDVLGHEVATLVNEFMSAGNHQSSFDARKLASGIYLYRLEAGDFMEIKKMLLAR